MRAKVKEAGIGLFWLLLWELLARSIGNALVLPTPFQTLTALGDLMAEPTFFSRIVTSQLHVLGGFLLAAALGSALGWIAAENTILSQFLAVPVQGMRAIPVACFVVFALFLLPSAHLALLVVFLLVFPLVYQNAWDGRRAVDDSLLTVARCFHVPFSRRFRGVLLPGVVPFLSAAFQTASGLAWKGGVAAEMIAFSANSVGDALFQSKILLDMPALFAWTAVILFISYANTVVLLFLWKKTANRLMRIGVIRRQSYAPEERTSGFADHPHSLAEKEKTMLFALQHVGVSFAGKAVLQDISTALFAKERVQISGPSGRGKTTLLNVIAAEKEPDEGRLVYGADPALRCSIVFQENRLLEQHSVRENLRFVGLSETQIEEGLAALELLDAADKMTSTLSGGMKRRLALLRALLSPGDLLLLDEPFTGLDEALRKKTADYIFQCSERFSALLVCDPILDGEEEVRRRLGITAVWHIQDDGSLWCDARQV